MVEKTIERERELLYNIERYVDIKIYIIIWN